MSLTPGTKLGPYEILAPLGAGGMGEVYRARDTRLGRDVAVKVLPEIFAADPERLARFTREATTLAALNHPNIAHLHGLEESAGVRALIMELVEGQDLAALIARGPVPFAEALPIARQIADGLEAAHEQGIVHRDLKPANVMLRPDGTVKVLDFGLAKALDPVSTSGASVSQSPTMTVRATQMGVIIGTAAYMSPEQARGKAVDRRADIWAYGVVLYEMLSGKRAFAGEDVSETLASVLKDEVDWSALPKDLPGPVKRLMRRCLEKDPRKRLSAIGDARLELDEHEVPASAAALTPVRRALSLPMVGAIAAVAVIATLLVSRLFAPGTTGEADRLERLSIALPANGLLTDDIRTPLALSPDGRTLVYVGQRDGKTMLFVRRLSAREPVTLSGTEGAAMPFFSPDGQWVGFFAGEKLKKIAIGGTELQVVTDLANDGRGADWGTDGNIYYAPTNISGLWSVPASGGTPKELTRLDRAKGEVSHRWPQLLPGGKSLLFSVWTGPGVDEHAVVVQSLASGERHVLMRGGERARYIASGHLLYSRRDELFIVAWDPTRASISGSASVKMPEQAIDQGEGAAAFAVSDNGTLAYVEGSDARYAQRLVWADHSGKTDSIPAPERDYEAVAISPDGRQAAVQIQEGATALWIYDFERHTLTPFLSENGSSQAPVWTTDGKRILYRATRRGLRTVFWKPVDGSSAEERITAGVDRTETPTSVTPDGQFAFFHASGAAVPAGQRLQAVSLSGDHATHVIAASPPGNYGSMVSPDGKWLAYVSRSAGEVEVYVQPYPGPGAAQLVSISGGEEPAWASDSHELFYRRGNKFMAVTIGSGPSLVVGPPRVLFEKPYRREVNANTCYAVARDERFLLIEPKQPDGTIDHLEVVLGWSGEVKRFAAGK